MNKFTLKTTLLTTLLTSSLSAQIIQESFEGTVFPPADWTLVNNGSGNDWTHNTYSSGASEGSKSMRYKYDSSNDADAWIFSKDITLEAGKEYLITFDYRANSSTFTENIKVTMGTDNVVANHTNILLDLPDIGNESFETGEINYTPTQDETIKLGFNCYSSANNFYAYIDNIIVQETPTCLPVETATSSEITDSSANITWEAKADEIQWEIALQKDGDTTPTSGEVVSVMNHNFTELEAYTSYNVYLRSVCSDTDSSLWKNVTSFETPCASVAGDYGYDLSTLYGSCWTEKRGAIGETPVTGYASWTTADYLYNSDNPKAAKLNYYSNKQEWLSSPKITGTDTQSLSFDLGLTDRNATTATNLMVDQSLHLMISTDNEITWTELKKWDENTPISNEGQTEEVDLSAYTGQEFNIAFLAIGTESYYNVTGDSDIYIKDFQLSNSALAIDHFTANSDLQVYPNPVKDILNINTEMTIEKVEVFDLTGRLISTSKATSLNVSTLKDGIYILKIKTDKRIMVKKFIKK